jgi:hypothetical protein
MGSRDLTYYRNYSYPLIRAYIEKYSNSLIARIQLFSGCINYLMDHFLHKDTPAALWTQGVTGRVFGFLNDRHVDGSDCLHPSLQAMMIEEAQDICAESSSAYTKSVLAYLVISAELVGPWILNYLCISRC